MIHIRGFLAMALATGTPALGQNVDMDLSGRLDFGLRHYPEDGQLPGQAEAGSYAFYGLQLEGGLTFGDTEFTFEFSGIEDPHTDQSTSNLQKAYLYHPFDNWDLLAGVNIENWGVSSSGRSIINVLNARDEVNTITGGALIGTTMVNANFITDYGTFSGYVLSSDVNANFGGSASRTRSPLVTDQSLAFYEGNSDVSVALRYTNNFPLGGGSLDVGTSFYHGTSRDPVLLPACNGVNGFVTQAVCNKITNAFRTEYEAGLPSPANLEDGVDFLLQNFDPSVVRDLENVVAYAPYYQDIQQLGLTLVYADGDSQVRFEGIVRDTSVETFRAAILGGERRFYGLFDPKDDFTLALEYHYDSRGELQPRSIFEDDIFFGFDYSLNDPSATRAKFGVFHDLSSGAQLYSLSASRRIADRFSAQISARHIKATGTGDPLAGIDNGKFYEFTLSTFF